MELRPIQLDPASLQQYVDLFRRCFPSARHFNVEYLKWLYALNPAGTVVGFDAWDGMSLAAHYACVPVEARIEQASVRLLLSLNTATAFEYQGKGLFTRLAAATYVRGAEIGFHSVYGVANANSTPGFIRKLGFCLISPLDARIGIGSLPIDYDRLLDSDVSFRRHWTPQSFSWRIANPARNFRVTKRCAGRIGVEAETGKVAIRAWAEVEENAGSEVVLEKASMGLHLHLGLTPIIAKRSSTRWLDLPDRLRFSPLNLIYRPLVAGGVVPSPERILFGQLDFDAF